MADRAVPAPAALFEALPDLVAFIRNAVDIRTVDVEAASAAGVLVTHAAPGFVPAVTELVLGHIIDLLRGISTAVGLYRSGRTPPARVGRQLAGSTVGVIGCGNIGRSIVPALLALNVRVLVHDPYVTPEQGEPSSLADLLGKSDCIVCLAALTPETAGLIGAAQFAAMKEGAIFLNASRGELVDEAALEEALESGHLAGAALDVGSAPDQLPDPNLASRPDVVATPHIGGLTREAADAQAIETVHQAELVLRGEAPPGSVNRGAATRLASLRG